MTIRNLLLGILIVAVFGSGLLIGRFSSNRTTYSDNNNPSSMHTTIQSGTGASTTASTTQNNTSSITSNMTDDQKKMLSALGIDISTITPTMIACAETSLGASRVTEIKNGAALSFTEKAKLVVCYK